MEKGYLSVVLHAHLPFVHHPESDAYIEERWLFEAITETYLPLLDVFEGLVRDEVDFRVTMSISPTLLTMLTNPVLQMRTLAYLDNLISLAENEVVRVKDHADLRPLAEMYLKKFRHAKKRFVADYRCNIIRGFKELQNSGKVEIITSSSTHAFLPHIQTEQSLRAQIDQAVRLHTASFGKAPAGIWLPECGFKEGLDRILKEYGIRYFFTDTHGLLHAEPSPGHGVYAPVLTPHGVAAFARDPETSKQVWSAKEGYPGDYDYREYYRDIGYDLDDESIRPYLHASGVRLNTGIKYYRITGHGEHKDWYRPDWAKGKVSRHAEHFLWCRERQIESLAAGMDRKPVVVASYDAELFGHWWYEGPEWIDELCRKAAAGQQTVKMITPSEYLCEYPILEECRLSYSTWGRGGYGEVWLNESNAWIYRHLHQTEERMIELAGRFPAAAGMEKRALNQAARELLLAQSSDWAFIMDNRTMVDYAVRRTKNHLGRFKAIYDGLLHGKLDEAWLSEVEQRDAIFPDLDYRIFAPKPAAHAVVSASRAVSKGLKVLMLSWEYPPMTVGGLSRHVYDLSRTLMELGTEVHVVTCHVDGYPSYEMNTGVHVHRVRTYQAKELHFMDWVFQLNLAMLDYSSNLIENYGPFDLIHAHDWLVHQAAKSLKHQYHLPLAATIHATEHGRNHGLHTGLQQAIHRQEWELTYEAWRVIGCSRYMEQELKALFQIPVDKLDIIPNGVDPLLLQVPYPESLDKNQYALPHEKIVFFVGRLVREKGAHILLESIPAVLSSCPEAKFVISGKGPMMEELQSRTRELGLEGKVHFTGFVNDETRNRLLALSDAAVFPSLYEPFGIVALEAMAAGVPVIVSGVGGLSEIVRHGEDGYTVLPGNADSLAEHIIRMLVDPNKARQMAEMARRKVSTVYSWEQIARQTLRTYYKIVESQENRLENREVAAALE